jgi:hypothetical protein
VSDVPRISVLVADVRAKPNAAPAATFAENDRSAPRVKPPLTDLEPARSPESPTRLLRPKLWPQKALAEQTAKATGEIGQQIGDIQAATRESVTAIKEISGTIEKLSEISSTIAAAVEEQGAATQELPARPAGRARHSAGLLQYRRRAARRERDRFGLRTGAVGS